MILVNVILLLIGVVTMLCLWSLLFGESRAVNRMIQVTVACLVFSAAAAFLTAGTVDYSRRYSIEETRELIVLTAKRRGIKNLPAERIDALMSAFYDSQKLFDVPSGLLIAMAGFESDFRPHVIGSRGEQGVLQVGKMGRRVCAEFCGTMSNAWEQVSCGACWLRKNIDHCGSLHDGLTGYASGKCSAEASNNPERVKLVVRRRLNEWNRIDGMLSDE